MHRVAEVIGAEGRAKVCLSPPLHRPFTVLHRHFTALSPPFTAVLLQGINQGWSPELQVATSPLGQGSAKEMTNPVLSTYTCHLFGAAGRH